MKNILQMQKVWDNVEEIEQSVLGGLLLNNTAWEEVAEIITESDFVNQKHKIIFSAIRALTTKNIPADIITLATALEDAGVIEKAGGWPYIGQIIRDTPSAANVTEYARIARRRSLERQRQAAISKANHELAATLTANINDLASRRQAANKFIGIESLCATPPTENWRVHGYVAEDSLNLIFGDPGCGKSFIAIDLACHIATGQPWQGRRVKKSKVLYIAGEGRNGLAKRFKAWFELYGETPKNIFLSTDTIQLTNSTHMADMARTLHAWPERPGLIVVDTVNRNYGPGDENSTADMTHAIAGLDALRTATGAALLCLHHSGHAEKGRGRGSSVLRASMDCEYAIEKLDKTVQMRCTKAKDFDHPPALAWTLEKQAIPWADEEGAPLDSAALVPSDPPAPAQKPKTNHMGANQEKALDILRDLHQRNRKNLEDNGLSPNSARVTRQDWYAAMKSDGFLKQRCYESKVDLIKRGLVKEEGNYVFLMDEVTDLVTEW